MITVLLTNSDKVALIDDEDARLLLACGNWCLRPGNQILGFNRVTKEMLLLHQLIIGKRAGFETDHINRNPLDNRRSNLRFVTKAENSYNKLKTARLTSSKYVGVSFCKQTQKWRAKGHAARKEMGVKVQVHLGRFEKEEDAARAYNKHLLSLGMAICHPNSV